MLINQIVSGSKVTLLVMIGINTLEFETEAVEPLDSLQPGLVVNPITKEDKIINFHVSGVVCKVRIQNEEDNMPYEWVNVSVRKIKMNDKGLFHVLLSDKNVKPLNRREAVRVWLGIEAIAQIGRNKQTYDVTVKDISATGVGFICESNVEVLNGIPVHLNFFDPVLETKFSLTGIVVRKVELENNNTLYGCKLNTESPLVRKYVNQKQIQQARSVANIDKRIEMEESKEQQLPKRVIEEQ